MGIRPLFQWWLELLSNTTRGHGSFITSRSVSPTSVFGVQEEIYLSIADAPEFRKLLYRKFYLKYLNREVVRHIPSKAKELADRLVAVLVSMSVVVPDWKPAQPEGTPNWQLCLDQFLTFSRGMNLVFEQALELYRQFEQGGFRCITGFPQFGERFDSSWMTPVAEQWKDVTVTSQVCLCVLPAIYSRELEASHPIPGAGEKVLESRAVVTLL